MSSICHKRAKTRKKGASVPHKRAKNTPEIKPNGMIPGGLRSSKPRTGYAIAPRRHAKLQRIDYIPLCAVKLFQYTVRVYLNPENYFRWSILAFMRSVRELV